MVAPTNSLVQVQTYQKSALMKLSNSSCFVKTFNTRFENFQNFDANLGSSVTFKLPARVVTSVGLVAKWQAGIQRFLTLTCDQAYSSSFEFTAQERIFNELEDTKQFMEEFGDDAVAEIGTVLDGNIALNAISAVPVMQVVNGQTVPTGALHTESGPYRFFGDGLTAINSFGQLAQMQANYFDYGGPKTSLDIYLPLTIVPQIVNTGLAQFTPTRNDEMAMSWNVGDFGKMHFYQSNLMPTHISGTVGDTTPGGNVLTVISTNSADGSNITQITCSGAGTSDSNAIKSGDLGQFKDGVSGHANVRFLTFIGHLPSRQPVQIRVTADAASDGSGNVILNITPALQVTPGGTQNITDNIVAGMKITMAPSHTAGLIIGGKAGFLSMPRLPTQEPYPSSNAYDPDMGISMRMTSGAAFGQNQQGTILDLTAGSVVVPEYAMRILFPVTQ